MAVEQTPAVDIALFGALGDLALRKLFPALYHLDREGLLNEGTRIAGLARHEMSAEEFRNTVAAALEKRVKAEEREESVIKRFLARIDSIRLDFMNVESYAQIVEWRKGRTVPLVVYMSVPASLFGTISQHLQTAGCLDDTSRIVVEKPIGYDLKTSIELNDSIGSVFDEKGIYRIDHYLGKDTVQNLLALRFANPIFGNQWNRDNISYVEITVAETVGIEGRWGYFDGAGQLRDMLQNHVMQVLCMTAMEPPASLDADSIRAEKVKVLKALRPITGDALRTNVVRGQYAAGQIDGQAVPGYLEEEGANTASSTETFVAIKAEIDNWRWKGVPFYLRSGKRMPRKETQIVVHFRQQEHNIFPGAAAGNKLVIRLQPDEGLTLEVQAKDGGLNAGENLVTGEMKLDFKTAFPKARIPDAYERLILEVMRGRQYLFVRRDEVEASWTWIDTLQDGFADQGLKPEAYAAGSWGPKSANEMVTRDGNAWKEFF